MSHLEEIHGGCDASGVPVWVQIAGARVNITAITERWTCYAANGSVEGFAFTCALADGSQVIVVHDAVSSSRWAAERVEP